MAASADTRLTVPADPAYLGVCRSALQGVLIGTWANDEEVDDLKLVLSEVCADAIGHGGGSGMLEVEFRTTAEAVEIEVVGPRPPTFAGDGLPIEDAMARAVLESVGASCRIAELPGRRGVGISYSRRDGR